MLEQLELPAQLEVPEPQVQQVQLEQPVQMEQLELQAQQELQE